MQEENKLRVELKMLYEKDPFAVLMAFLDQLDDVRDQNRYLGASQGCLRSEFDHHQHDGTMILLRKVLGAMAFDGACERQSTASKIVQQFAISRGNIDMAAKIRGVTVGQSLAGATGGG